MKYRRERVARLIKEELNKIIIRNLEFPDCLMTITEVEVDVGLTQAIINFSVLPSEKSEMALKILEKNRNHLQYLLLKKINIKPMPQIIFKIDRGPEESAKIEKILLDDKMEK